MRQEPIDLLPDDIRARSLAGVVAGRYVAALLIAVILLGLTATHSRLMLDLARQRKEVAENQADLVLAAEAKADQLRGMLRETEEFIANYQLIAMPLEVSRVIATVTNLLSESTTIERLDVFTGVHRSNRSARGAAADPRQRILTGELSGFAASDKDVASIVASLESMRIFEQVSLDFSRTRTVRGANAREFRISFRIDLSVDYEIDDLKTADVASVEWRADVQ